MIWQSEWEMKTKIFEYCEGWKALYGDVDTCTHARTHARTQREIEIDRYMHSHSGGLLLQYFWLFIPLSMFFTTLDYRFLYLLQSLDFGVFLFLFL